MAPKLPSFKRPPVVEVVMGVQFGSPQLSASHFGLFWNTVRDSYPNCSENPPILPQIEDFEHPIAFRDTGFQWTQMPPLPRVFFEDASGNWLIQLQRDRFLHNWRSSSANDEYPRYPEVRKRFLAQWANFRRFVSTDEKLGDIKVNQLEMTYLNHMTPWTDDSELGELLPDLQWRKGERVLDQPEAFDISFAFASSDRRSRLRVGIKPGIHEERGNILLFDLTVRGAPRQEDSFEEWFDEARRWIVTAFADLTSKKWHKAWEPHDDRDSDPSKKH